MAILNLTVPQGATWNLSLLWKDSAGNPVNLNGYSAAMQIRRRPTAPIALSVASGNGITLGGTTGTIDVTFAATVTDDVKAGRYIYDLELTSSAGEVTRLVEGTVVVRAEVTQ